MFLSSYEYYAEAYHEFISQFWRWREKKTVLFNIYQLLYAFDTMTKYYLCSYGKYILYFSRNKIMQQKKSNQSYQEYETAQTGSPQPNISTT